MVASLHPSLQRLHGYIHDRSLFMTPWLHYDRSLVMTPWLYLWPQATYDAMAIFSLLREDLLIHTLAACIITG